MAFEGHLYVCWLCCSLGYEVNTGQKQVMLESRGLHFLMHLSFVCGLYAASVDTQIFFRQTVEHTKIDQSAVGVDEWDNHDCLLGLPLAHTHQIVKMMPPFVHVKHYYI
jgi:hypothetical protein